MPSLLTYSLLPPVFLLLLTSLHYNNYKVLPEIVTREGITTHCYPGGIFTQSTKSEDLVHGADVARCFTVGKTSGRVLDVDYNWERGKERGEVVAIPGLWDGHGHVLGLGEYLGIVKLFGAVSVEEIQSLLETALTQNPTLGTRTNWLRGLGWDQTILHLPADQTFPTAQQLISNSPFLADKYIMLDRADVHCVWVSPAVLALIPPKKLTNPPPGGTIPSEGVLCDNAMDLVLYFYPDAIPSRGKVIEWTTTAMSALNKAGIVGVHDAGVRKWGIEAWRWMDLMNLLTMRINTMLECQSRNTFCPDEFSDLVGIGSGWNASREEMLAVFGVKIFADGALGSYGAALIDPYTDMPEIRGTMLLSEEELAAVITKWYQAGYQISTHCIGDLAARVTVRTYQKLLKKDLRFPDPLENSGRRLRIEHAQIVAEEEQKIMKELGIIPSIQPTHATSDAAYAEKRLGPERTQGRAYRMKTWWGELPKGGKGAVLGSDFPVERYEPLLGIYAAVTRKNPYITPSEGEDNDDGDEEGWYPEEKLSIRQALEGFTKNVAYAGFSEGLAGEISKGSWADWVVLEYEEKKGGKKVGARFWEEGWKGDVRRLKVRETWVGGKKVYDAREEEENGEGSRERMGKMRELERGVMGWVQRVFAGSGI